ncbi:glycosyltransferase [Nocardiopsis alba]|uniref:Glycosyltransferase n=1 Tax=Nocardiopsis alba TaxID=53437 RepID=A0A7K2IVV2_9ACTN|nr:glycosyltransferase [Nocardiopsis alba]MYR34110.1 glycosyltransferase [Nocardiopsis alba]
MARPIPAPLPRGLGIEIDRSVRFTDEGHVLVGGTPPRALRLPATGVGSVIRGISGARPTDLDERILARTLVEAGLAHPRPAPAALDERTRIVLIGRGGAIDPAALITTLDLIAEHHPGARPLVVGATGIAARTARARGARTVDGPTGGPGALAAALAVCDGEFLALLEAGAEPSPGWLENALGHFVDPDVAAVIPRTLAVRRPLGPSGMTVAALHALRADRGADPAPVLPWGHGHRGRGRPSPPEEHGAADPLEPVRVLVARRAAVRVSHDAGELAGTDLVWRAAEEGWSVRYEPRSRVRLPMPDGIGTYLRSRFVHAAEGGATARRYGRWATGPEMSPHGLVALLSVLGGRPVSGLVIGAAGAALTARGLAGEAGAPTLEAVRPAVVDLTSAVRAGARTARTTWWPVLAGMVVAGAAAGAGGRRRGLVRGAFLAGAVLTVPHLASWRRRRGTATVGPLGWTALAVAGDAACALGTWWGVARSGSLAPLIPRVRSPLFSTSLESPQVGAGAEGSRAKSPWGSHVSES